MDFSRTTVSLTSFNAHNINDTTNYIASIPNGTPLQAETSVIYSERLDEFPINSGKTLKPRTLPIDIQVVAGSVDTLKLWFDTSDKTPYKLIVTDSTPDPDVAWYVYATPRSFTFKQQNYVRVVLDIADPIWRTNTATTDLWSVASSGGQNTITITGNKYAKPSIAITPRAARTGGFEYKRAVFIYNPGTHALKNYPVNLFGAGVDTSALVNDTSKSNTINDGDGITDSDTTITIDGAVGGGLPNAGMGYVDTEQISWTANSGTSLTGVTRGIGGTTAAAHLDDAVIAFSQMVADGSDTTVFVDGREVDRWVAAWNAAASKLWINLNFEKACTFTLGTAIASSGAITTITAATSVASGIAVDRMGKAKNKVVYIDAEAFTYTGVIVTASIIQLTGVTRAALGTSEAAHTTTDTVRWLDHTIWVCYGDENASTDQVSSVAVTDDAHKPILDLTNSVNGSWVYTDYYDPDNPQRTGCWRGAVLTSSNKTKANKSRVYGANHATNAPIASVASEMGMSAKSYQDMWGRWRGDSCALQWGIHQPAGVTTVSASGEKYAVNIAASSWVPYAGLDKLIGAHWDNVWTEAEPSSATTWEAFTHNAQALGGTYYDLRFVLWGTTSAVASNIYHMEIDSVTLTIANEPVVTMLAAVSPYMIQSRLKNITTGDYIQIRWPGAIDSAITIDCDNRTVTDANGNNIRGALTLSSTRQEWLTLINGANVFAYSETGLTDVDVDMTYEERSL